MVQGERSMADNYKGVFSALTTPFEKETISIEKFRDNIQKYNSFDLAGFVIAGSSGEAAYLTDEESEMLVQTAKEAAAPNKKILVGTARESTTATIAFTNRMTEFGVDAALIRTPFYFKPQMTHEALLKHYLQIADRAKIPIIPYHIPQVTGLAIQPQLVIDLAAHPNIVGIKDSSGNLAFLGEVIEALPSDFHYLLGAGSVFLFGLFLGASGGILRLADVAPAQCVELYNLFLERKWEEARKLQLSLIPLNNAIIQKFGIPGTKHALDLLGFHGGPPRPPIFPLDEKGKNELKEILNKLDLIESDSP
jgi:4-hydroxy-2-oxoglutarate aldolase